MQIMPQWGLENFGSLKPLLLDYSSKFLCFFVLYACFCGFFSLFLSLLLVEHMNIHLPLPSQVCHLIHRGLMQQILLASVWQLA